MLNVKNLSVNYGKKNVLFDISFEIKKGDIVLLAGSNGSGKSTLLKAIYGILPPFGNGQLFFDGEDITGWPTSLLINKGLVYIAQKNNLFEDLTVKENLEIAGLTLSKGLLKQRIKRTLQLFKQLRDNINRIAMKLSGGERQLLTLAMATLHEPKMILLDEPFLGLSPQNIVLVSGYLNTLNQQSGITILMVEHRIKESIVLARTIIGLKLGRIHTKIAVDRSLDINDLNPVFI